MQGKLDEFKTVEEGERLATVSGQAKESADDLRAEMQVNQVLVTIVVHLF